MLAKLFVIPFTSILIAAHDVAEARTVCEEEPHFVRDLYQSDFKLHKHGYKLAKPYLGNSSVIITTAVLEELNNAVC